MPGRGASRFSGRRMADDYLRLYDRLMRMPALAKHDLRAISLDRMPPETRDHPLPLITIDDRRKLLVLYNCPVVPEGTRGGMGPRLRGELWVYGSR